MKNDERITIADLYPELPEGEQEEAAANLRQYLTVLLRMAERLQRDGRSIVDMAVDCSFDPDADQRYHPTAAGTAASSTSQHENQ